MIQMIYWYCGNYISHDCSEMYSIQWCSHCLFYIDTISEIYTVIQYSRMGIRLLVMTLLKVTLWLLFIYWFIHCSVTIWLILITVVDCCGKSFHSLCCGDTTTDVHSLRWCWQSHCCSMCQLIPIDVEVMFILVIQYTFSCRWPEISLPFIWALLIYCYLYFGKLPLCTAQYKSHVAWLPNWLEEEAQ